MRKAEMPVSDTSDYPLMKKRCSTCPFNTNERGRHPCPELVDKIQRRCLSEASQICHHPRLGGKPETHLCRGARDFQLLMFYRMGLLDKPTDEAWARKVKELVL